METIELYSCEELWDFFKKNLLTYIEAIRFYGYEILNLINTKDEFSCILSGASKHQKIIINYSEFKDIYNQLNTHKIEKEINLSAHNYLEIPLKLVNFNECIDSKTTWPIKISDKINQVDYEIYYGSKPYNMCILNQVKKIQNHNRIDLSKTTLFSSMYNLISSPQLNNNITTKDIFDTLGNCITLKISTHNSEDLNKQYSLSEAMIFNLIFNYNLLCSNYTNIHDILNINTNINNEKNKFILNECITPPQRIYKKHILDYYRLAFSSKESLSQYISYYHVLEFFFDEIFNQNLRKAFQDKITHTGFSYKSNSELDKVINFIKKETRNCKENGQGNELESLKQVLKKFIDINELQEKLTSEQIEYFQKNQVSFSHAPTISFKDKEGFYNNLAQRIYQTRNSLVHSKEGNVGRYKPYQDSEELSKEIPLIKLIAEQVIINSSDPL